MLSAIKLNVANNPFMLSVIMLNVVIDAECHYAQCHNAERRYAECRYAECRYAECHYAECRYAECHYAECHYAECHYAECHYAECHGAKTWRKLIHKYLTFISVSQDTDEMFGRKFKNKAIEQESKNVKKAFSIFIRFFKTEI